MNAFQFSRAISRVSVELRTAIHPAWSWTVKRSLERFGIYGTHSGICYCVVTLYFHWWILWAESCIKNSVAHRPRANYTDWANTTRQRNLVRTLVDREMSRNQRGGSPTIVNLSFLDRSRYFCFEVTPHLSSQGLSGPLSRPNATQKNLVAPGIEPRTSVLAARNSDHYTTKAVGELYMKC
jgi:hypothetical protein